MNDIHDQLLSTSAGIIAQASTTQARELLLDSNGGWANMLRLNEEKNPLVKALCRKHPDSMTLALAVALSAGCTPQDLIDQDFGKVLRAWARMEGPWLPETSALLLALLNNSGLSSGVWLLAWRKAQGHAPHKVLIQMAGRPTATKEVLTEMANNGDRFILRAVAKHPNTPSDVLKLMVRRDRNVRRSRAYRELKSNPNTPTDAWL